MSGDFRAKIKFMGEACDASLIPWRTSKKKLFIFSRNQKGPTKGEGQGKENVTLNYDEHKNK